MKKYSYEWFVEQSRAAQQKVDEWPSQMKRNIVLAVATLPALGEDRHDEDESKVARSQQAAARPRRRGKSTSQSSKSC